jgi:dienelactone hydrolase
VLSGWYLPSQNGAAIVVLHGSGSTRSGVLDQAVVLARHGYGALLFDARGHGRSTGAAMDVGWFGTADTAAAVDFLQHRPDVDPDRIGVLGESMGGEEAVTSAASDHRIRAVAGEGVQSRVPDDHPLGAGGLSGAVERVTTWEQYALIDLLTDAPRPRSLHDAVVAAAPTPILLIAGRDEIEPGRAYRDASPGTVELWELPDTDHTAGLATHPGEWEARVTMFFDRALGS